MLNSVLSFIVALGILVFLHEYGHYSIARLCKVRVIQFSVGFGKPVFKWLNKKTGVLWTVGWIPLGGFVRMLDERDPESTKDVQDLSNAFNRQSVWKRIAIVAAGPIANLLVAWFLYSILALAQTNQIAPVAAEPVQGTIAQKIGLQAGDSITSINGHETSNWSDVNWEILRARLFGNGLDLSVSRDGAQALLEPASKEQIQLEFSSRLAAQMGFTPFEKQVLLGSIRPGSPAEKAGLASGDVVLAVDGVNVQSSLQFTQLIKESQGREVNLELDRKGSVLNLRATPELITLDNGDKIGRLGVGVGSRLLIEQVDTGLVESISDGAQKMVQVSVFSLTALGQMLTGEMSVKHLSGPVSIATAAGESSSLGILPFIGFLAMVSVSLGILNLLPIPVLDGGHLMYYFAEILTGRPVSEAWMMRGQKVGLLVIGLLTSVAFFNDIQRLLQ